MHTLPFLLGKNTPHLLQTQPLFHGAIAEPSAIPRKVLTMG